ncbi:hypothetical protein [Pseudoalteromonas atlantica]|uniref:hypothetical protein n=1 Tax=Pseudoalteromonas atlantica TaxID=288 RepID=UPI0037360817
MFGIGAVCSAIGGAISAGCSAIGGALGAACGAIGGVLGPMLNMKGGVITTAFNIIGGLAKAFNIMPVQANIENDMVDLGARVDKSDLNSEAFSSAKEYIDHLRNSIEISREEINSLSDEKKNIHKIIGASLLAKGVSENYTMDIPATFWGEVALSALSSDQVYKILDGYKVIGIPADLRSFTERNLSLGDNKSVYSILADALKNVDSDNVVNTPEELIIQRNSEYKKGITNA